MGNLQKVLIMAGGTGGHVFPGLAVAQLLGEQGVAVDWLGTASGLEARLVPESGIPIHYISISGVRGKGLLNKALAPFRLFWAVMQSMRIIHQLKPDVVLGMGGFASGPGGIASWLLRYPLVIHEQNAKAGLTNKWLARFAVKVLEGFPGTFPANGKAVATGNPVRIEIAKLPSPDARVVDRVDQRLRLLVLGGSLGAAAINDLVPQALAELSIEERPLVYHQTGAKHLDDTLKAYAKSRVEAEVVPFITDMDKAYAWADIVLCRAGALTIAELCAAGLGAILVPYPHAVDDHQTANANYLVKNHAALLIQQTALTVNGLATLLRELAASPTQREAMAHAAYQLRQIDATNKVFKICGEICR
jgi:UDP-N-acetylglucosamine--N-acetylmuramyl-(pentapeptide) pyrophosphoryl-undecaprenol N-acetylglucosamine transferase